MTKAKKDVGYYVNKLENYCLQLFKESEKNGNPDDATAAVLEFGRAIFFQSIKSDIEYAKIFKEKAGSTEH